MGPGGKLCFVSYETRTTKAFFKRLIKPFACAALLLGD